MAKAKQDVIGAKLGLMFETVDADHNGYLDWSDYRKLAERYVDAYHLREGDRRARALHAFFQAYWLELLRHAGVEDDRLTKEQFVVASRLASIDTSRINIADGAGHVMFDVVDVNGDNEISEEEFARCLREVWRTEAPEAIEAFRALDTDRDGAISREEFIGAVREHLFSNNPDAPGSLFFGHI
ncbi:Ca2+-binding EF-hand superfamily protein [Actinokineospora baliensis]|uniref:EF-hand domain-containing protein n=1 Tax=Actinokineospora baliensis TaxID=547056 RepID=UPI00195962F2|nr:EF-hand domain-containing protein [Actinokineospora baliensis]MBM7774367.1 Ca2+-binding EF-hand superfamily protein [Actinokineospora baliensis]